MSIGWVGCGEAVRGYEWDALGLVRLTWTTHHVAIYTQLSGTVVCERHEEESEIRVL